MKAPVIAAISLLRQQKPLADNFCGILLVS